MNNKIFIAIPNMGEIVSALTYNLFQWAKQTKIPCELFAPEGWQPLDNARNKIVAAFLSTDCTHIWWIDSDVIPPIDALPKLLQHNKSIISACCFCMREESGKYFPYPVTLKENKDKYEIYYGQGVEQVDAVGGGCVLIKREVYETIGIRPYEFIYEADGSLKLTCDFNIWRKVKGKGFKIHIDYNVLCDHQRKCSIKGFQDLLIGVMNGK